MIYKKVGIASQSDSKTGVTWPIVKSAYQNINFLISQPKHVVGTQKNRLNETVLLHT